MRLTYNADPRHVLLEKGERVPGGSDFEVTAKRGAELLADPTVSVTEVSPGIVKALHGLEQDVQLQALSRSELNDQARKAGVEAPEQLSNKDAVITAIHRQLQQDQTAASVVATIPSEREANGEAQQPEGDLA